MRAAGLAFPWWLERRSTWNGGRQGQLDRGHSPVGARYLILATFWERSFTSRCA